MQVRCSELAGGLHSCSLLLPARVDLRDPTLPRLEIEDAGTALGLHHGKVALVHIDHVLTDHDRLAHRQRRDLDLAGALEAPHGQEHLGDRPTHHYRAVVLQHQHPLVAEILHQPLTLFGPDGHALEIVVADLVLKTAGVEIGRLEAALKAAHRHARGGVGVADGVA